MQLFGRQVYEVGGIRRLGNIYVVYVFYLLFLCWKNISVGMAGI